MSHYKISVRPSASNVQAPHVFNHNETLVDRLRSTLGTDTAIECQDESTANRLVHMLAPALRDVTIRRNGAFLWVE